MDSRHRVAISLPGWLARQENNKKLNRKYLGKYTDSYTKLKKQNRALDRKEEITKPVETAWEDRIHYYESYGEHMTGKDYMARVLRESKEEMAAAEKPELDKFEKEVQRRRFWRVE